MQPLHSYLICATPRSGSTLLCEALTNTGMAGNPKEYFEVLKDTGLPRRPKEYFTDLENSEISEILGNYSRLEDESIQPLFWDSSSYPGYLAKVFEEGTTPNGVFGAKIMWGYFDDFINNLRLIPSYRDLAVPDLMATIFPNLQYIQVTRFDKVRQAVSLWKAIQTWTWKMEEDPSFSTDYAQSPSHTLTFHFEAIDHLVRRIIAHEACWQQYLKQSKIQPFTVVYEQLTEAYEETLFKILHYLNIPIPENLVLAERRMKKQADGLSEEWVQRYHQIKREQEQEQR